MIERDFHGWSVNDALQEVELIIGQVRKSGKTEQAEFVTGYGTIRQAINNLLEKYSLSSSYKLGNNGVIVAIIE